MAMTTITSSSVKRSWASIVTGKETPAAPLESELPSNEVQEDIAIAPEGPRVLQPAKRGERWCHCMGEVLVMLGHYAWILPFDDIEYSDMDKTAGRVYLHKRDMPKGVSLVQGDTVSFCLYADDQGLGAECVRLEKSVWVSKDKEPAAAPSFRVDASEFVPGGASGWSLSASEFVPNSAIPAPSFFSAGASEFVPGSMNIAAQEFVPAMNLNAQEFVPAPVTSGIWPVPVAFGAQNQTFCAFNLDLLSDSDDDSDNEGDNEILSGNEADKESISRQTTHSDQDSSCNESLQSSGPSSPVIPDKVVDWKFASNFDAAVTRRAPWKSRKTSSDGGSTGAESDSEAEDMHRFSALVAKLKFPTGVRPPPGLSLPELTA